MTDSEAILVSISGAAARLGIGVTLVKLLIRRGDLATIHIGDRRLVPVEELRRYVAVRLAEMYEPGRGRQARVTGWPRDGQGIGGSNLLDRGA